jgi:glutathione peroxidase
MRKIFIVTLSIIISSVMILKSQTKENKMEEKKIYSFVMKTIDGKEKSLGDYKGKVLMIVNVASKCGNTPQYKGLEEIYEKYKDKGFMILGFPANNFFRQEPGTDSQIKEFCTLNYGVTFDMFSKISVKGDDQHPLYKYLTEESPATGTVKWNFQKYLVDRDGNVVEKIAPGTSPTDEDVVKKIEQLLSVK